MEFHNNKALHQAAHELTMEIVKNKVAKMTIGIEPEQNELIMIAEIYREVYKQAIVELQK